MLNIFQGSGVDPAVWEARLAAIEAKVDMLLTLLPPSRLDVIAANLDALEQVFVEFHDATEAKLDQLLALKMGPPRCGCGKVMYADAIGELHCDYCEGVPSEAVPPGGWRTIEIDTEAAKWREVRGELVGEKWGGQPSRRAPIHDPNGGRS